MKRCLYAAVLAILLTSCNHEPPPYESHYVTPATSPPSPASESSRPEPLPQPSASFADSFDRSDTDLGLGEGWDMRGKLNTDGLTPSHATDGFIKDGHYTYAGASSVIAMRQFRGVVRSLGTVGRFRQVGPGYAQTALSMVITRTDQQGVNVMAVAFSATRSNWNMKISRADGTSMDLADGKFSPMLELDRDYRFEFEVTDDKVTVGIPDSERITKSVSTAGLLGDRAFWQEYPLRPPAAQVFDFDTVWAVEDGQPLFPVPLPG